MDEEEGGQDKLAIKVLNRWAKGDRHLRKARKDFWLNYAFYEGAQWVWWDSSNSTVQMLPERFFETERVRLTVNKIESRVDTLLGKLCERDLSFEGDPTASDDQALTGSKLAEAVLETAREDQDWESVREENMFNALMGGTSAIAVEWDTTGGERIWRDESSNKIIGTGEVSLAPLSIAEFTVEPASRRFRNANYWISATAMPPEQARAKYDLNFLPEADASRQYSPLQRRMLGQQGGEPSKDLCIVYVMYERPNRKEKKGRMVVVVNEKSVLDDKWPFPFDELNLAVFRQGRVSMRWWGKTFVTSARPVQVAYNAVRSNISEHIKLAGNARLWVPHGSMDDTSVLTDEPGEIVEYWPTEGGAPSYTTPPPMQRSTLEEAQRLEDEIDDLMHAHDVSRGVAPGDRNSGFALSVLAEKNDTPLGPMSRDQARGWGRIGTLVLKLYEEKADEKREAVIITKNSIPRKLAWSGKDLRGQTRVQVPLDSTAPHSRAQMLGMLQTLQQMSPAAFANIPPEKITKMLGLASEREMQSAMNAGLAKAQRENDLMSVDEVRIPDPWDDHASHIAEHNEFRSSQAFEQLPQEVQALFAEHIQAHQTLAQEEIQHQASLNAIQPNLGALPQANDPIGSAVPPSFSAQQKMPA